MSAPGERKYVLVCLPTQAELRCTCKNLMLAVIWFAQQTTTLHTPSYEMRWVEHWGCPLAIELYLLFNLCRGSRCCYITYGNHTLQQAEGIAKRYNCVHAHIQSCMYDANLKGCPLPPAPTFRLVGVLAWLDCWLGCLACLLILLISFASYVCD